MTGIDTVNIRWSGAIYVLKFAEDAISMSNVIVDPSDICLCMQFHFSFLDWECTIFTELFLVVHEIFTHRPYDVQGQIKENITGLGTEGQ